VSIFPASRINSKDSPVDRLVLALRPRPTPILVRTISCEAAVNLSLDIFCPPPGYPASRGVSAAKICPEPGKIAYKEALISDIITV